MNAGTVGVRTGWKKRTSMGADTEIDFMLELFGQSAGATDGIHTENKFLVAISSDSLAKTSEWISVRHV